MRRRARQGSSGGESTALIMPGSWVRVPPLLSTKPRPEIRERRSGERENWILIVRARLSTAIERVAGAERARDLEHHHRAQHDRRHGGRELGKTLTCHE